MDHKQYQLTDEEIRQIRRDIDERDLTLVPSVVYTYCREVANAATAKVLRLQAEEAAKLTDEGMKCFISRYLSQRFVREGAAEDECDTEANFLVAYFLSHEQAKVAEAVKAERERIKDILSFLAKDGSKCGTCFACRLVSNCRVWQALSAAEEEK